MSRYRSPFRWQRTARSGPPRPCSISPVGPSVRAMCTRCCFSKINTIQACSNFIEPEHLLAQHQGGIEAIPVLEPFGTFRAEILLVRLRIPVYLVIYDSRKVSPEHHLHCGTPPIEVGLKFPSFCTRNRTDGKLLRESGRYRSPFRREGERERERKR